jgi:hypothetical protein
VACLCLHWYTEGHCQQCQNVSNMFLYSGLFKTRRLAVLCEFITTNYQPSKLRIKDTIVYSKFKILSERVLFKFTILVSIHIKSVHWLIHLVFNLNEYFFLFRSVNSFSLFLICLKILFQQRLWYERPENLIL